jgi:hypothetical protein
MSYVSTLPAAAGTATPIIFYSERVGISTLRTFIREKFRTGTSSGSLIGKFYGPLMAFRTKAPFDTVKFHLFLFEIIGINRD